MRHLMATILIIFLRSSVRCPAIDADHPLPPECNDNQQRLEGAEFCRAVAPSVAAGRDFDSSVFLLVTDCFVAIWSLKLCVEISFDSVR